MSNFRLAIVVSHPIQYYTPLFKMLATADHVAIKVFYTLGQDTDLVDQGFGKKIEWDIPLLKGYEYEFLENSAQNRGSHHFMGIKNKDLISKITSFMPDAILIYGWSYHSHLKVIRHFTKKIPLWFRGDSTITDKQTPLRGLLKKFFLRWVYSQIDQAFYTGSNNKAYFTKYGLKKKQLIFAPHAVDRERFAENRGIEASALRHDLGVTENQILVLFAGKFEMKKDPLILLDAFIKLNAANVHLLFVGSGDLEESLKDKVESLSFDYAQDDNSQEDNAQEDNAQHHDTDDDRMKSKKKKGSNGGLKAGSSKPKIHFMDFQNQRYMPVIYQACDLFCLPSKGPGETWGLAVNEAMATGKAILVSDKVGCATDLVEKQKNGYIFKAGDLDDLYEKLKAATESTHQLKRMGAASALMSEKWTLSKQVEIILNEINRAKN